MPSSFGISLFFFLKKKFHFCEKEEQPALMLEVGEVLAAPALEDLIPAGPAYGTKSGTELDGLWHRKQLELLEEQKAIIHLPHGFLLAGAKRIRSKLLDDYTNEVKSRLVATVVVYGNRDDCFAGTFASTLPLKAPRLVVSLAVSRGRSSHSSTSCWRLYTH